MYLCMLRELNSVAEYKHILSQHQLDTFSPSVNNYMPGFLSLGQKPTELIIITARTNVLLVLDC